MKSVFWESGQRVIQQILDFFQTGKEENTVERRQDYTNPGIVKDLLNEFDIIVGTNNTPSTPSITVRTGVAYDTNGERILIDDENVSHDATNPSDTTDDGKGNLVATPHSTGSLNIPLNTNQNNFVWIDYLLTTDETEFTLQKITNAKQFYKRIDGYQIVITTVDTPPTSASLKLGNVDLTGGGVVSGSTISLANRIFSATKPNRVRAKTMEANQSDKTATYTAGTEIFVDEHIRSIGELTPTVNNPHGTGPEDIGLSPANTVQDHQQFFHTTGIVGSPTTSTSSLFPVINTFNPGEDQLIIKPLVTGEEAHIDGLIILPDDISTDVTVLFNALDPNGTYYIFLDKNTKTIQKTQTDLITTPDVTKMLLCRVDWTYPGATSGDLTNLIDDRTFGVTSDTDIQRDLPHFVISLLAGSYPVSVTTTYSATAFNALTTTWSGTDLRGVAFSFSASYTYTPGNDDPDAKLVSSTETFTYGPLSVSTSTTYGYDGNDNLTTITRV